MGILGLRSWGGTYRWKDVTTYGNSPLCPTGHWPFGAAAQKRRLPKLDIYIKQSNRQICALSFCKSIFSPHIDFFLSSPNKIMYGDGLFDLIHLDFIARRSVCHCLVIHTMYLPQEKLLSIGFSWSQMYF